MQDLSEMQNFFTEQLYYCNRTIKWYVHIFLNNFIFVTDPIGQPAPGSSNGEPVEGQLEFPPLRKGGRVGRWSQGCFPMDPEPSPQTGPHSLHLPPEPMSGGQEEHE